MTRSQAVVSTPCQICGNRANKGLHFSVDCCRACAAFYRRTVRSDKVYRCQRGGKNCDLKIKFLNQPICRYCRLQRCKQLGMHMKKALNSIETGSSSCEASSQGSTSFQDSPESTSSSNVYDIDEGLHEILRHDLPSSSNHYYNSFLQKLHHEYFYFYDEIKPTNKLTIIKEFKTDTYMVFRNRYENELARLLMRCSEFVEVPYLDKVLLFKHVMHEFFYIERIYTSILHGGSDNNYLLIYYDSHYKDLENKNNEFSGLADITLAEEKSRMADCIWENTDRKKIELLYKPMLRVKLDSYEMIFILAQILWTTQDIKNLSPSSRKVCDSMLEQISNELHDYYVNELGIHGYASRLEKLLKLIDGSKAVMEELTNAALLTQVFDIFEITPKLSNICEPF